MASLLLLFEALIKSFHENVKDSEEVDMEKKSLTNPIKMEEFGGEGHDCLDCYEDVVFWKKLLDVCVWPWSKTYVVIHTFI